MHIRLPAEDRLDLNAEGLAATGAVVLVLLATTSWLTSFRGHISTYFLTAFIRFKFTHE